MINTKYTVIDSFLEKIYFDRIKYIIMSEKFEQGLLLNEVFPWVYNNNVTFNDNDRKIRNISDDLNNYYFGHIFYGMNEGNSSYVASNFFQILTPLIKKIKIEKLIRVKANLRPRTKEVIVNPPHYDYDYAHRGAIYYVNSNNGYTILNDGTKVQSIENRILFFDSSELHSSTTCTDEKVRVNININYY